MVTVKKIIQEKLPFFYRIIGQVIMRYKWRRKLKFDFSSTVITNSTFEGANKIRKNTRFMGSMGYGSYISENCQVEARIGRFTSIAPGFVTNKGIHPIREPFVTTSPIFYSTKKQCGISFAKKDMFVEEKPLTVIGNDVWIGQNVFMSGGIKIGDGAVVLAGAVVTKDVEPYAIVGGVPASLVKYRYDEETRDFLKMIRWWNQSIPWLQEHWNLLCDLGKLKEYYNSNKQEFNHE